MTEAVPFDAFPCISCGGEVSFVASDESKEAVLDKARCPYCDVVNDRALALVQADKARLRHEERVREELNARRRRALALASAAALVFVLALAAVTYRRLAPAHAEAERAQAQLTNVRERRAEVLRRLADAPEAEPGESMSELRQAMVEGAENRVRVERSNYDAAAAAYNAVASSPWARLIAMIGGMPERVPLTDEAQW